MLPFLLGRGGGFGRHDELERDEDFSNRGFGGREYSRGGSGTSLRNKGELRGFESRKSDGVDRSEDDSFSGESGFGGNRGFTSRPGWNTDRTPDRFREQELNRDQGFGSRGNYDRSERGDRGFERGFDR